MLRPSLLTLFVATSALAACGDSSAASSQGGGGGGTNSSDTSSSGGGGTGGSGGAAPTAVPGLYAEYYAGYLDRVLDRVEPTVDVDWADGGPAAEVGSDHFSARWTGFVTAPESGTYTIATETDDGVRLWVGDALVIDDWHGHFVTRNEGTIDLVAGVPTPIRLEYFEIDLAASMRLLWSSAALPEEIVPADALSTFATPSDLFGPKPPYTNPVIPSDCPDPGVLNLMDAPEPTYAAVCTGGAFPIRTSRGLVTWANTGTKILPSGKPSWAANGNRNWAPEIHRVGSELVAYFTSVNASNVLSIGVAHAATIDGPWTVTDAPLVQNAKGVIDATEFDDDDGSHWLLYKIDGNSVGQATPIFARQLSDDGLSFAAGSTATQVLTNDSSTWEGGVVEAPWVVTHDGMYYLFYSGNVYDYRYRTGVARSASLLGPYEKHGAPILGNNSRWVGPGHGSVVRAGSDDYFVYHAWTNAGDGTQLGADGRQVLVDRIDWSGGWPSISDGTPSHTPQPWPGAPSP